jgi:hypothetical protein
MKTRGKKEWWWAGNLQKPKGNLEGGGKPIYRSFCSEEVPAAVFGALLLSAGRRQITRL